MFLAFGSLGGNKFNLPFGFCFIRRSDVANDPLIMELVKEQTVQWSQMLDRHQREEWDLLKSQLHQQGDVLKKLMEMLQSVQMKQIEAKFERFVLLFLLHGN